MKRILPIALALLTALLLASCDDTLEYCNAKFTVDGKDYYINGDTYESLGLPLPAATPYGGDRFLMYCVYSNARCTRRIEGSFFAAEAKSEMPNVLIRFAFYNYKENEFVYSSSELVPTSTVFFVFNSETDTISFHNIDSESGISLGSNLFSITWNTSFTMNAREVTE